MILLLLALLLSVAGYFIYKRRLPVEPAERREPSTRTALRPPSEKDEGKKVTPSEELRQQVADLAASTPQAPGPALGDAAPSSSSGSSAAGEKPSKKTKKKSSKRKKKKSKRSRHAPPSGAPGGGSEGDKKP